MNCSRCKSSNYRKDGFARGLQRYKCKSCNYRYTVLKKSDVKPLETRRLALEMYLEGLGFRSIGRILKISYGTVYSWVKKWSSEVSLPRQEGNVKIVELDELHSYIGSKKTTDGFGLLLIDLEKGLSILSVGTDQLSQVRGYGNLSKV